MKLRLLKSLKWPRLGLVVFGIIPVTIVGVNYYSSRVAQQIGREVRANMAVQANLLAQLLSQGNLANSLDWSNLNQQLNQITWSQTGYVLLIKRTGRFLVHPPSAEGTREQLSSLSTAPPVQQIWSAGEGSLVFEDALGVNWVAYGQRLEPDWVMLVIQPEEKLFASQKKVQIFALVVTALTALILGLLTHSFNRVNEQLEQSGLQLKTQIQERTAQLQEAQEAAATAKGAKDRLIANLSHELRASLQGILAYAKLLRRELPLTARQREKFKLMEKSGGHLLTLINQLGAVGQNPEKQLKLPSLDLNLPEFLGSLLERSAARAQAKGVEIKLDLENVPTRVLADETRLQQILINLLDKALKVTEQGRVTLRVRGMSAAALHPGLAQQKIRFEVIDSGGGINRPEPAQIFPPGAQAVSRRSERGGGDLAISQQLVELMGGQLLVTSQLGQGSNFWFEIVLTLVSAHGAAVPPPPAREKQLRYEGAPRQILVVDDQEEHRRLLVKLLSPLGFQVLTAENGEQMFEVLERHQPDLICLDLFMPKKTGLTSAKQLRQRPEYQNIPLFVLSSTTITEELERYLPCDEFLSQPLNQEKLIELLSQYLHLEWVEKEVEQVDGSLPSKRVTTSIDLLGELMTKNHQVFGSYSIREVESQDR